jgi:ABC-type bacteriocin/lantibiotic exporter with double-glycine peptidase domain
MKFKHCLLFSVFFASLFIIALVMVSKPMTQVVPDRVVIASKYAPRRMTILPARHIPNDRATVNRPL